jgi:hypothetical protein
MSVGQMSAPPATVAAKECGGCTMCCKIMRIDELAKPTGQWCTHCKPGRGCGIYPDRPQTCRVFHCLWITQAALGPEWRPDKCKMVLMAIAGGRTVIKCDPGFPQAWRKQPYYAHIRSWADRAGPQGGEVLVCVGHDITVLARDRELHVGIVAEEDGFATDYDAAGRLLRCRVIKSEPVAGAPVG